MRQLCEKGVFFINDIVDETVILDCVEINKNILQAPRISQTQ